MKLEALKLNRLIGKDPAQTNETKSSIFTSSNPAPKTGSQEGSGGAPNRGNEKDDGSKNILTGTVITACLIQTSGFPFRVEMSGNDITFFDDTFLEGGKIKGDTARLVFTHDLNSNEGFIMEKRASLLDTYDNVLSWYATPAKTGRHNYMFIGRNGDASDAQRNLSSLHLAINFDSVTPLLDNNLNGVFELEYSTDGVLAATNSKLILMGASSEIFFGSGFTGFSSIIAAADGGISGIAYSDPGGVNFFVGLYATSTTNIALGMNLIPDTNAAYDIGSPTFKIGTLYGSVSACPLPTIENALEILDRIPEPTFVGERGHYGNNRKYFDDLTFPSEILYTNSKGVTDIEHNHMLGFLLKVVIELRAEINKLKK